MGERDITPERELRQPGPEEHPGEGGSFTDAARTRLKRRDPEGERLEDAHDLEAAAMDPAASAAAGPGPPFPAVRGRTAALL